MTDPLDALVLDLLEFIAVRERPLPKVLEAWRTSCPRLPVWETANERGFVARRLDPGAGTVVTLTESGRAFLAHHGRTPVAAPADA